MAELPQEFFKRIYKDYQQGVADGYSQAETDYHKQTEKDRQSAFDCGYEKGREDAIDDYIKDLEQCYPLVDNGDILYGFSCAIQRLKQLKEKKNDNE